MATLVQNKIAIDKETWEEYSTLVDLISHERDKIQWNYIKTDDIEEISNFLND